jgi:hypothetical protein
VTSFPVKPKKLGEQVAQFGLLKSQDSFDQKRDTVPIKLALGYE